MSSLAYLTITAPLTKYGVALTIAVNSFLIYLTYNRIRSIAFSYKCLIVLMALLGIIFSLLETLVHPFVHSYNASFIYFSSSISTSSTMVLKFVLLSGYSLTYMVIICCLAIQFIYRYLVILSPNSVQLFEGWKVSVWIVYSATCSVFWLTGLNLLLPDDYSRNYWRREMERNYDFDIDQVTGYQLVAYDENHHLRVYNCLGLSILSAILTLQYILIVYFGFKTHFGIKSIVNVTSSKAHRLHTQLFKTLVLQITVPTVLYNSPVFLMYTSPYFDFNISFPSGIMICFFSFYPAADSLVLMWMVGEYHRIMKKIINKMATRITNWTLQKIEEGSTTTQPIVLETL